MKEVSFAYDFGYVMSTKVLANNHVYIHVYVFRSMFCRKGRTAMATRNTLTSVRPMISGPLAFCESTIYL